MVESAMLELRRKGREHAREALGACLLEEASAEQALNAIETEMWRKRDAASDLSDDDTAVEEFARWLPEGRRRLAAAQSALDRANEETVRARAVLAHADLAIAAVTPKT